MEQSNFDFTAFANMLVSLFVTVIIPVLGIQVTRLLAAQRKKLETQHGEAEYALLADFVRTAVSAAEQLYATGLVQDRLGYALEVIDLFLTSRGIDIDEAEVRALIESAVREAVDVSVLWGDMPEYAEERDDGDPAEQ